VSTRELVAHLASYRFTAGSVMAVDGRVMAHAPAPGLDVPAGEALVPAAPLDRLMRQLSTSDALDQLRLHWTPTTLTVHASLSAAGTALRTRLPLVQQEWPYAPRAEYEGLTWAPWSPALHAAVSALSPYVSENATQVWAACIAFAERYAYATNNVVVARHAIDQRLSTCVMLPAWGVAFLLNNSVRTPPAEWAHTPTAVWFRWETGAWVRVSTVVEAMPLPAIERLFNDFPALHAGHQIPESWRQAFQVAVQVAESGSTLVVHRDRVAAGDVEAGAQIELDTGTVFDTLDAAHHSAWDPTFLKQVLTSATRFDPGAYPGACPFDNGATDRPPALTGFIIGRRSPGT
jgi:hypothetical protein